MLVPCLDQWIWADICFIVFTTAVINHLYIWDGQEQHVHVWHFLDLCDWLCPYILWYISHLLHLTVLWWHVLFFQFNGEGMKLWREEVLKMVNMRINYKLRPTLKECNWDNEEFNRRWGRKVYGFWNFSMLYKILNPMPIMCLFMYNVVSVLSGIVLVFNYPLLSNLLCQYVLVASYPCLCPLCIIAWLCCICCIVCAVYCKDVRYWMLTWMDVIKCS